MGGLASGATGDNKSHGGATYWVVLVLAVMKVLEAESFPLAARLSGHCDRSDTCPLRRAESIPQARASGCALPTLPERVVRILRLHQTVVGVLRWVAGCFPG